MDNQNTDTFRCIEASDFDTSWSSQGDRQKASIKMAGSIRNTPWRQEEMFVYVPCTNRTTSSRDRWSSCEQHDVLRLTLQAMSTRQHAQKCL
eukprot:6177459-Pleurochrysis_carterae.AAC.2